MNVLLSFYIHDLNEALFLKANILLLLLAKLCLQQLLTLLEQYMNRYGRKNLILALELQTLYCCWQKINHLINHLLQSIF